MHCLRVNFSPTSRLNQLASPNLPSSPDSQCRSRYILSLDPVGISALDAQRGGTPHGACTQARPIWRDATMILVAFRPWPAHVGAVCPSMGPGRFGGPVGLRAPSREP